MSQIFNLNAEKQCKSVKAIPNICTFRNVIKDVCTRKDL